MKSARDILAAIISGHPDRPPPARFVRVRIEINGHCFIDLDSKLALAMVDCNFGKPVVNDYEIANREGPPTTLRMILEEGGCS